MGVSGKLSVELEIKSSPDEYFQGLIDHGTLFDKALPDDLHKSEVHEGDGKSVDSINSYTIVLGGDTVVSTKGKVEAVDEENKSITMSFFDGHLGELYSKYKLQVQVLTKDGKNFVNCTIEYEKRSEDVPEAINYLEHVTKFCKGLEAYLLQA